MRAHKSWRAVVAAAFVFTLFAVTAPHTLAQDTASLYAKDANWQKTLLATRALYQQWRTANTGVNGLTFGPWYMVDPLKADKFTDVLFPEQKVDLEAKRIDGNRVWNQRNDFTDGVIHALPSQSPTAIYLYRTITAAQAMTLSVGLGSDDGIEFWLNGAKLLSNDVHRGVSPDADRLSLPLVQGENQILFKVYNALGDSGFYFSISDDRISSIWNQVAQDFPRETAWMNHDAPNGAQLAWFADPDNTGVQKAMLDRALENSGPEGEPLRQQRAALDAVPANDPRWLDLYVTACKFRDGMKALRRVNLPAMKLAVQDLAVTFPDKYPNAAVMLARIEAAEKEMPALNAALLAGDDAACAKIDALMALQAEALGANPLLDFGQLLLVKRSEGNLGLPQNWQGNCAIAPRGYDNEIAVMSPVRPGGTIATLYKPEGGAFVGDVDLNFDAKKMLFSMPGAHGRWQIFELNTDGSGLRQVTPGTETYVDNYDPCYLPDGRIMFDSTRCVQGIPCVGGGNTVANLCRMEADGSGIRQLCFDQDHDWCPTLLNNGRVMYSRWEYSDTPHYFSRILFSMNPDGTNQVEYYGSNSFWPNSIFYARPIPGHPSQVVAIVSGHHGVPRMGELVIFDPARGRFEADGVVQRIPNRGQKVEPVIMDTLVDAVWPRFLHPYPLSDKYFLVSCKPNPDSPWGIYLVDVFDNLLLLAETPGYALFEPVPFREIQAPPVIPDKTHLDRQDATVYLTDVYRGNGLKNVPRGAVKSLRLYEIYYTYPQMGGHINIGVEGPWDVHRILGTVPVYEDGSAYFTIPSNIPIAVQPLDEKGRALQLMRSWFVGMPGEAVSCAGCHESQNTTPPPTPTLAAKHAPDAITPWKGPARGFSFKRDVQPVLDKYCAGCHNGSVSERPDFARKDKNGWGNFTPSYLALHPYVRRPGPESDYHLLKPLEFSATTSELIQMLEKGHFGVKLDQDAWERLYTWIDLNVPDHGTWGEHREIPGNFHQYRLDMRTQFANRPEDPEVIPALENAGPQPFIAPERPAPAPTDVPKADGWPFDANAAAEKQKAAASATRRTLDLGNGVTMDMVLVPAGSYVMGANNGCEDERPMTPVAIDKPFWMSATEVTLAQFQQFDPAHENGVLDQHNKDHTTRGYPASEPTSPAIRVNWNESQAFCAWLSGKIAEPCALPSEAQWEWACRAGADTPFWYGNLDTDFSKCANLADASIRRLAVAGINPQPIENPSPYENFLPQDARFDDGNRLMCEAAKYQPNPWGLLDIHGNVAEWTASTYMPYPYSATDGREDPANPGKKVVRGGSWMDRPKRARASYRLAYEPWQSVYNVGFRVIIPAAADAVAAAVPQQTEPAKEHKDMRIVLAADPWGRELKDAIKAHLIEAGYQVEDLGGTQDHDVNYYDVAPVAARKIQNHEADRAVLCCGTGMGMAIVANKFKGVYASVVESVKTAGLCSAINKANVLTLGGMIMTPPDALQAVDAWLNTAHTQGLEQHKDFLVHALDAVAAVENDACK